MKLYNEAVRGLDPWSDTLTMEEKRMILQECKENIVYYIMTVTRLDENQKQRVLYFLKDNLMLSDEEEDKI